VATLNEDAQWIVLMGFIVCVGIFFLAILLNQSILVGQSTAESVLEFPKSDLQDLRNELRVISNRFYSDQTNLTRSIDDITKISMDRKTASVFVEQNSGIIRAIHYNNGVTAYNEKIYYEETASQRWNY
jgi:hypothetical protein